MAKSPARNGGTHAPQVTELPKITVHSDTRDILAHAIKERETDDYFIVDVDAHVMETAFWSELTDRIDNDVYRQMAKAFRDRGGSPPGLLNATPGMLYQDVFGRIPHQQRLAEAVPAGRTHRAGHAGAAGDGRHGDRLHGGVPHPDAGARHAPAGRDRGGARERVQSLAGRGDPAAGAAHQGDALPAVQPSGGLRGGGRALRGHARCHRFHGDVDALRAGA